MTVQAERPGRVPVATYKVLAQRLRVDIRRNRYAHGRRLPTEAELSETHKVSRQTVRRAFQDLVAEGIVYRVPGRGTFAYDDHGKYLRSFGSIDDLMAISDDTEMEVTIPPRTCVDLGAAGRLHLDSDQVVSMAFRRLHAGQPFCHTTVFLPVPLGRGLFDVAELSDVGTPQGITVLGVVQALAGTPIVEAQQSITAVSAPPEVCEHLDVRPDQPVLRIDRLYADRDKRLIELAINHFDPSRYSYRLQIRATQG